jgi:hypothetical protein
MGIMPSRFKSDGKNKLIWIFEDLEPSSSDNVILRYEDESEEGALALALKNKKNLFAQVDALKPSEIKDNEWSAILAEDFDNHSSFNEWISGIMIFFMIFGIPLLIFAITILLGIFLYRKYRNATQKNS